MYLQFCTVITFQKASSSQGDPVPPQHSPPLPPMVTVNQSSDSVNTDLPIWDISYKWNHTLVKQTKGTVLVSLVFYAYCNMNQNFKAPRDWRGGLAERAPAAPEESLGPGPSTHITAHNCLFTTPVLKDLTPSSGLHGHWTHVQCTYNHAMLIFIKYFKCNFKCIETCGFIPLSRYNIYFYHFSNWLPLSKPLAYSEQSPAVMQKYFVWRTVLDSSEYIPRKSLAVSNGNLKFNLLRSHQVTSSIS